MPRAIQQTITFPVPPEQLYRIYLSSRQHSAACGWGDATIVPKVGGRMVMGSHIRGAFLLLRRGRIIVQTWRGSNWKRSDPDSVLVLTFHRYRRGCRLTMVHANVPDAHAKSITGGWRTYYWNPWTTYLKKRRAR